MKTFPGVEDVNVLKDIRFRFSVGRVVTDMNQLGLECGKGAFHRRFSGTLPVRLLLAIDSWLVSRCWQLPLA